MTLEGVVDQRIELGPKRAGLVGQLELLFEHALGDLLRCLGTSQPRANDESVISSTSNSIFSTRKRTCFDAQGDVVVLIFRLAQHEQEVVEAAVDLLVLGRVALDTGSAQQSQSRHRNSVSIV